MAHLWSLSFGIKTRKIQDGMDEDGMDPCLQPAWFKVWTLDGSQPVFNRRLNDKYEWYEMGEKSRK